MKQVDVSEFAAACSRILEQVHRRGEPVEILQNGDVLAVVYPPARAPRKSAYGALKGTLRGTVGDLMTPPPPEDWEALSN